MQYEILIFNTIFIENLSFNNGGALAMTSHLLNISKCQFIRNAASYGGSLYFFGSPLALESEPKNISVDSTIFYMNLAVRYGGVIYTPISMENFAMNFTNVYCFKNAAMVGGAISLSHYSGYFL